MCFGGGGGGTITMPDTSQYDSMADQQIALMKNQQEGSLKLKQNELNTALARQQSALTDMRDFKVSQAADVQENARRLSALMGPPPPDKSASAPVIGRDRKGAKKAKGKKGLRVGRARTQSQAKGTGLSITI